MKNKLQSFFTEHWKYLAVSTACKFNLFDHLQEPKSAKQLAQQLNLHKHSLFLLLNALHQLEFLDKQGNLFQNNAVSELLTENHPESLKYACLNWSAEHLTAWQHLDFSIKTGKSSFEKIYGKPFFDYLNDYPEKLHAYHKAMYEYAKEDYKTLPDIIDLSKHKSIMDVGGGYGAVLEKIKAKYPNVECILLDLPKVIEKVTIPNIQKIDGNFLEKIPNLTEVILLTRVLHDWNDEKASTILKNCFETLPQNGTLYIIENCTDKIQIDLSLLSLNMLAMCESFERSSKEYLSLAEEAGFKYKNEVKLNELQTILIFEK